ncbi:hypothetical protein U9M48_016665 [Paspalum notatum var. saurae]|uniref:Uncharacterized protein n=1 Tax=Paspalum notatum var. saurae TaxID=547442 RepID=A0AAQ3T647_PASNO
MLIKVVLILTLSGAHETAAALRTVVALRGRPCFSSVEATSVFTDEHVVKKLAVENQGAPMTAHTDFWRPRLSCHPVSRLSLRPSLSRDDLQKDILRSQCTKGNGLYQGIFIFCHGPETACSVDGSSGGSSLDKNVAVYADCRDAEVKLAEAHAHPLAARKLWMQSFGLPHLV